MSELCYQIFSGDLSDPCLRFYLIFSLGKQMLILDNSKITKIKLQFKCDKNCSADKNLEHPNKVYYTLSHPESAH